VIERFLNERWFVGEKRKPGLPVNFKFDGNKPVKRTLDSREVKISQ
jgi:hypothetical protein